MKNYFYNIFIAFFLVSTLQAQQQINTEFKTKTLQVFQNLDQNRVPHGILLDFGMEFTNLQAFNGTLTDSTYTNSQTLSDIYKTLLMCRVQENATTGFITPQEYATRWYSQRTEAVITLSGQYFKYSRFTDNAYPNKLNYTNNQFSDKFVGSVWQNPYEEKQLFAMTSSIAKYKGFNFQVKLPANLFLSNYPATVQNIQVDFQDGLGYRIVAYDQLVNVNYTQANTYTWKYKIMLTNGQTLLSHSKIEIEEGLNAVHYTAQNNTLTAQTTANSNLSAYAKTTITATTAYNGALGSATVYIKYKTGGNSITKPLIVAEGFDTGVILTPEQEAGDNNIEDFLRDINNSFSNLPIETNQYDIIYVDWNNGVDFIQRNAFVLEEVIRWVNTQKANNGSTLQNVVLGQSMGGLIARYALKDMENNGLNHDTRLYVSHDAPHLGANVPLSIQHSARHLRNVYVRTPILLYLGEIEFSILTNFADGIIELINNNTNWTVNGQPLQEIDYITPLTAFSIADTPASRQMQYNWVNRKYEIKNGIHDIWQQELSNMGYPIGYPGQGKPIRNIAIANGSECGVTQVNNGNILSYIKDAGKNTLLSNYIGIMDFFFGSLISNPAIASVGGIFPGKSYWQVDFQSKYMTTLNQNKNIYHGSIKYKKKVFWFIPVSITVTELDINQPSGVLPYDIYGGGNQKSPTNNIPLDNIVSNNFGFIPTASSLDIGKGTTVINDIDYRKSYVGALPPVLPKNSPFQNFVTHFDQFNHNNNNSKHISFNRRNGNWLRTELNTTITDEYTNCAYICSSDKIEGNNIICTTANYSAPNGVPFYNWTITQGSNLVTLTGNGTPNITLTALPNQSGQVLLSLSMGDDGAKCGNITLTKSIWVGKPILSYETDCFNAEIGDSNCFSMCRTNYFEIQNYREVIANGLNLFANNSDWEWQKMTTNFAWNTYNNTAYFQPYQTGYIAFKVRVKNVCGWSDWLLYQINVTNCSNIGGAFGAFKQANNTFVIYPNPSKDIVNIELRDRNNLPEKDAKVSGELFDLLGFSKTKVEIQNNKAIFSVRNLNKGIYILKIYINDQIESHQIAVE
ncbi:T9SS type A sorting domain-containing protein [Flavobacterium sp.]|uniref:T9SS type A sorting domain-containing protein n=1 Tax=Flavobacterium sp. TaxID=239 RepID=UPI0040477AD6